MKQPAKQSAKQATKTALVMLLFMLGACSMIEDIGDWMGGGKEKTPLPGKRIAVLNETSDITPDDSLNDMAVTIPDTTANDSWPQAGGGQAGITGNLALSGFSHHDHTNIGDHNRWEQPLYPSAIVAGGMVVAMDAKGYITAHAVSDIDTVKWSNQSLINKEDLDVLGGGVAFEQGRIYATSGRGKVVAMDAATGKELWIQNIGVPLRAAPKTGNGKVYALSVDNQLFALDADKGTQLWSHRGINENAGFLAAISPAVSESVVLAPYSSGEIHALDTVSGEDVWTDTLLLPRRNYATASFSGIGGNPIIRDDVVYAPGSAGFIAAIALSTGRRIWEQDISSLNTPWLAGDFLYMISTDDKLVCLKAADGRVKWTVQLPQYGDEKKRKKPLVWRGPIMAGGQLLVAGTHGQLLQFSPKDGGSIGTVEIPENITDTPIVAGGRLYMLTQDARLHVFY